MNTAFENPESPVFACALPPAELRQRRLEVLSRIRSQVARVEETANGFTFHFAPREHLEAELAELVEFEAACCSFIQMEVATGPESTFELRMTSVPEAKPLIRAEFVDV